MMNKLKSILTAFLNLIMITLSAQTITNVVGKQVDNSIIITYSLYSDFEADISLYYSEDEGAIFKGPLKSVIGDINFVNAGNHSITWNILQDMPYLAGEKIIFRVTGAPSRYRTFTDPRDGHVYKTVRIGEQTWMAENLAYKPGSGNYWVYDSNPNNISKYGYLYDWETAKTVAPSGWHLPSSKEWEALEDYIGCCNAEIYNAVKVGGSTCFNALMGGNRKSNGTFSWIETYGAFWCKTTSSDGEVWFFTINYDPATGIGSAGTGTSEWLKQNIGLSVRLIKN